MRAARDGLATVAGCAVIALSACGAPAQQAAPTQPPAKAAAKAPHVRNPLNAQPFLTSPCSAMTTSQVSSLGLAGAEPSEQSSVKKLATPCRWINVDTGAGVAITWLDTNSSGLDVVYGRKQTQAYFQPVTVDGYPGVFTNAQDARPRGSCELQVGVSDKLVFTSGVQTQGEPPKSQSCAIAQRAAAYVIQNLKQKQGAS